MSISSRVFSAPPRSARESEARTSFTPAKDGLCRTVIMVLAALVSSWRRFTSAASADGVSASARSFAASDTASCESMSSTAGSSSVISDFSEKLIYFLRKYMRARQMRTLL